MKQSIFVLCFSFFLALAAGGLTSCGDGHSHDHATEQSGEEGDKTGPEYTSAYICTMHCEGSGSDNPGKCPVCGMEYVANEHSDGDHGQGDSHEHNH